MTLASHLNKARKIAIYTNVRRARISAIAFSKSGQIITSAYNRRVDGRHWQWTEHAEEGILKKMNKLCAFHRYSDINILVIRVLRKDGQLSLAKPCSRCRKKLEKYPVTVLYSTHSGDIIKM